MAKCSIRGKGAHFGNAVYVCTSCLKSGKVERA